MLLHKFLQVNTCISHLLPKQNKKFFSVCVYLCLRQWLLCYTSANCVTLCYTRCCSSEYDWRNTVTPCDSHRTRTWNQKRKSWSHVPTFGFSLCRLCGIASSIGSWMICGLRDYHLLASATQRVGWSCAGQWSANQAAISQYQNILPWELSDQEASGSEQLITKLVTPPPIHTFPPKNFLHFTLKVSTSTPGQSKKEKLPISPSPFPLPLSYPGRRLRNKRAGCPWRALPRACVHQNQSSRPTEIPDQEK